MKLKGVMPALVTPFDANYKIDFKAYEKLLTKLRADGVTGWVPCGSTGEYNAMTAEERVSVQICQGVRDQGRASPRRHQRGLDLGTDRAYEAGL
jgi:dihydrodipicolinate synthase/N-acetylneuraminate lyase